MNRPQCAVGIDFGSHRSKVTLACKGPPQGEPQEIRTFRVPYRGPLDDPERPENSDQDESGYEFVAHAALEDGKLVAGRQSLSKDDSLPLKTILLHAAGIVHEQTLGRLPGGPRLLEACRDGVITPQMGYEALVRHHQLLYKMAKWQAATIAQDVEITHVVISYPNYLVPTENPNDFSKYMSCYIDLLRPIWGQVRFDIISEGRAAALYITERFFDPLCAFARSRMWDQLRSLNRQEGLYLLIADCGSSSLNIQLQSVFFDEKTNEVLGSQSIRHSDWLPGVCGGSHVANSVVRDIIEQNLNSQLEPGDMAALLNDFEKQKYRIDWADSPATIHLHCSNSNARIMLRPENLEKAFKKAFRKGLRTLKAEVRHAISQRLDFAIIFCGGSYFNKGLRRMVEDLMAKMAKEAQNAGVGFKHLFLAEFDTMSSSAVSVGAALSVMRIPSPIDVLNGSAIALQAIQRDSDRNESWTGEDEAGFLFSKGCGQPPHYSLTNKQAESELVKFSLVCDPNYFPTRQNSREVEDRLSKVRTGAGSRTSFQSVKIGQSVTVINNSMSVYDLGFSVMAAELPSGRVRFIFGGAHATSLARDADAQSTANVRFFILEFSCCSVDRNGRKLCDPLDKMWLLKISTDPATKLLIVDDEKKLPMWCYVCCTEMKPATFSRCTVCEDLVVCWDCLDSNPILYPEHRRSHGWERCNKGFCADNDLIE